MNQPYIEMNEEEVVVVERRVEQFHKSIRAVKVYMRKDFYTDVNVRELNG
jgi:hypothetical protein